MLYPTELQARKVATIHQTIARIHRASRAGPAQAHAGQTLHRKTFVPAGPLRVSASDPRMNTPALG